MSEKRRVIESNGDIAGMVHGTPAGVNHLNADNGNLWASLRDAIKAPTEPFTLCHLTAWFAFFLPVAAIQVLARPVLF